MKKISDQKIRQLIKYKLTENFKRKLLNEVGVDKNVKDSGSEENAHITGTAGAVTGGALGATAAGTGAVAGGALGALVSGTSASALTAGALTGGQALAVLGGVAIGAAIPIALAGYGGYLLAREAGLIGFKVNTGDDDIENFFIEKLTEGLNNQTDIDNLSNIWSNAGGGNVMSTNQAALSDVKKAFEQIVGIQKCHDTDENAENWNNDITLQIITGKGIVATPTKTNSHLLPLITDSENPNLTAADILTNQGQKFDPNNVRGWFDLKSNRIYYRATPNLKDKMEKLLANSMKKVKSKHYMPGDEDWIDYLEGDINNLAAINFFSTGTTPVWSQKNRWYSIKMTKQDLDTELGKDILKIVGIKAAIENAVKGETGKAEKILDKCGVQLTDTQKEGLKDCSNQKELKQEARQEVKQEEKQQEAAKPAKIEGFVVPRLNRGYYDLAEILVNAEKLKACFPKSDPNNVAKLTGLFKTAGLGNVKNVMKAFTAEGENYPKFLKQGEILSLGDMSKYGQNTFPNIIAANPKLENRIKLNDWMKQRDSKKKTNQSKQSVKQDSEIKRQANADVDKLVKDTEYNEKQTKQHRDFLKDLEKDNSFKNTSGTKYPKNK